MPFATYTPQAPVAPDSPTQGQQPGEDKAGYFGSFVYNNQVYMPLTAVDNQAHMYISLDSGVTWSELDAAHAPSVTNGNSTPVLNGSIVTFACKNGAGIRFFDFNLATGLWGSAYGAGGSPANDLVHTVYVRPDGTYVVIYTRLVFPTTSGLYANFFNPVGATWAGEIDAGANILPLPGYLLGSQFDLINIVSCMGADGSVYLFWDVLPRPQ